MKVGIAIAGIMIVLFSCTPKDNDIKQSIAVNVKEDLMFAGVNYTVQNGVVTLTGNCPSEELRNKVVKRIQASSGVKKVVNNIAIAAVVLDSDFILKQKVDSLLASHATVNAEVKTGVARLKGTIKVKEADKLMKDMSRLPLSGVENGLLLQ